MSNIVISAIYLGRRSDGGDLIVIAKAFSDWNRRVLALDWKRKRQRVAKKILNFKKRVNTSATDRCRQETDSAILRSVLEIQETYSKKCEEMEDRAVSIAVAIAEKFVHSDSENMRRWFSGQIKAVIDTVTTVKNSELHVAPTDVCDVTEVVPHAVQVKSNACLKKGEATFVTEMGRVQISLRKHFDLIQEHLLRQRSGRRYEVI